MAPIVGAGTCADCGLLVDESAVFGMTGGLGRMRSVGTRAASGLYSGAKSLVVKSQQKKDKEKREKEDMETAKREKARRDVENLRKHKEKDKKVAGSSMGCFGNVCQTVQTQGQMFAIDPPRQPQCPPHMRGMQQTSSPEQKLERRGPCVLNRDDQGGLNNGQGGCNSDQGGCNNGQRVLNNGQRGCNNGQRGCNNGQRVFNNRQGGYNNGQGVLYNGQRVFNNGQRGCNIQNASYRQCDPCLPYRTDLAPGGYYGCADGRYTHDDTQNGCTGGGGWGAYAYQDSAFDPRHCYDGQSDHPC